MGTPHHCAAQTPYVPAARVARGGARRADPGVLPVYSSYHISQCHYYTGPGRGTTVGVYCHLGFDCCIFDHLCRGRRSPVTPGFLASSPLAHQAGGASFIVAAATFYTSPLFPQLLYL